MLLFHLTIMLSCYHDANEATASEQDFGLTATHRMIKVAKLHLSGPRSIQPHTYCTARRLNPNLCPYIHYRCYHVDYPNYFDIVALAAPIAASIMEILVNIASEIVLSQKGDGVYSPQICIEGPLSSIIYRKLLWDAPSTYAMAPESRP